MFDGRFRATFGVGALEYEPDDPRAFFAAAWMLVVEAVASGMLRAAARLDKQSQWGGDARPMRATFGRTASAREAAKAHVDLAGPALVRERPKKAT